MTQSAKRESRSTDYGKSAHEWPVNGVEFHSLFMKAAASQESLDVRGSQMTRALIWAALYKRRRYPIIKASAQGYWSWKERLAHHDQLYVDFFPLPCIRCDPPAEGSLSL